MAPHQFYSSLKLLRYAAKEPPPWTVLRSKDADAGAVAQLVARIQQIHDVEAQNRRLVSEEPTLAR